MLKSRFTPLLLLPLLLSIGCPETAAQRGRDALKQVAAMHRELYACHRRHARAFALTPEAAQARGEAYWPRCALGDVEGLALSRDLELGYLKLRRGSSDQELADHARLYVARKAAEARTAVAALERAGPGEPGSLLAKVRAATLDLQREDAAITGKYLAGMEAQGPLTPAK